MIRIKKPLSNKELANRKNNEFDVSRLKDIETIIYGVKKYPITLINGRRAEMMDIEAYIVRLLLSSLRDDDIIFNCWVDKVSFNIDDNERSN